MKSQIIDRDQLISKLKFDIKNINNQIEKGYTLFKQKQEEVSTYESEFSTLVEKQLDLERKIKYLKTLQSDYRRFTNDYGFEKHKSSVMINECGVPRNVHRWTLYQAINPTYARNLKYHMLLTSKLANVYKAYSKISSERDALKEKLQEQKNGVIPNGSKLSKQFNLNLENCRQAINDKEAEIKELSQLIQNTRDKIDDYKEKIDQIRGKVTQRKNTAVILHTKNYTSRTVLRAKTSQSERPTFFITQNPDPTPTANAQCGGGFVIRKESNKSEAEEGVSFGALPAYTPRKLSSNQILKPSSSRNRPKTSYRQ
jgi:DNA repair exonuclease SbcCD ATPase subunit